MKLAFITILLAAVCLTTTAQIQLPTITNYERVATYIAPKDYTGSLADAATAAGTLFANFSLLCDTLTALLNSNENQMYAAFQASYAPDAASITQNKAWCDLSDANGRLMDKFSVANSISASASLRTRELNRNFMFNKIYATASVEMTHNIEITDIASVIAFKGFFFNTVLGGPLAASAGSLTCGLITTALQVELLANLNLPIVGTLLGLQSKKTLIQTIQPSVPQFFSLYARNLSWLAGPNPRASIKAALSAEWKSFLVEKVTRKVHKWADLITCFGENNSTTGTGLRRNVIKRIYDLAADFFDKSEVDYVIDINIIAVTSASGNYIDFSVAVNVTAANATKVGIRLGDFIRSFIEAYSHPKNITIVKSARGPNNSKGGPTWNCTGRATPAPDYESDPRDLTGDKPTMDVPTDTPDNTTDPEYKDVINNYNVKPQDYNESVSDVNGSLADQTAARADAEVKAQAANDTYTQTPAYNFAGSVNTDIQAFVNLGTTIDLVQLRTWAANVAIQVKRAQAQAIAKVKADLADQVVAAKNCEILSINLKLQVIRLVTELNGTSRAGCNLTIPDWTLDTFGEDDCYNLTQVSACLPIANVLLQLNLLKQRMLTAITVKNQVNAQVEILTAAVNQLEAKITAYGSAMQTSFDAKKSTADLKSTVAAADFKARVASCIRTMTNGILTNCTYDYTYDNTNVNLATHSVNAQFDATVSASLGVTADMIKDRVRAGLQICLSINLGGDLSYFKAVATGSASAGNKRGVQQQSGNANSNVQTDFSDGTQQTTGTSGTSSVPSSTTAGTNTIVFSFVSLMAMFLALLL